ncbi:SDR family oxidoreductase [candidate division GN15 bacterium]|nr:SDR family oxidoreductase [candidate division GN15 bacterium]
MDLGLTNKHALVTGASSGLGAASAMALAREGATVVINARDADRLAKAADWIEGETGNRPGIIAADIATARGLTAIEKGIRDIPIDILVSNGGGPPPGQFLEHESARWEDAARLVLDSARSLTRMVLPGMIDRGWGRLLYITSVGVLQPVDDLILSNTYRAGVTAMCKTISNNYAQHGVTANCVCPGYTATERLMGLATRRSQETGKTREDILEEFASMIPRKRVGNPEELGALVAFLAGEQAGYISGTSIPVDGGLHKSLL